MSSHELERVEVMGRVSSGELKLRDAAVVLELSLRQAKRLWRQYRKMGSQGLKHGNAGRRSNRSKPLKLRRRVLHLIRKKYSGSEVERFGPTLALVKKVVFSSGALVSEKSNKLGWGCVKEWQRSPPRPLLAGRFLEGDGFDRKA